MADLNLVMNTAMLSGPHSGLTTNNTFTNCRKRGRESGDSFPPVRENPPLIMPSSSAAGTKLSILGEDVPAPIQQPQQEIERFIALQTERVRSDLEEKQKRQSRRLMAVLEGTIVKKLKQKELEIESIGKVNCALEERVRSLCIENQIWQNLARSNEATANALRSNLEQALAHANEGHGDSKEDAGAAESCCCNNNNKFEN
ncbi:putative BOI-related E3 ubiquitin-protein ligase 3 [Nymphaea thermarum]|nr:putative BOI-related E3 ubiquitin-protein ligase 3 [Nymphaea thermarum]